MSRRGEAGILGAVLIAFLIISAIATYAFIARESDTYINTVNKSLQTREKKFREKLDVYGYPDTHTLEIKNTGDIQSHIVAFILLDNETGKMSFYKYSYRLSPTDDVKVGFNEMGSYPPYISGVLTDLGNIFWDEIVRQNQNTLKAGDNITSLLANKPLDYTAVGLIGTGKIGYIYLKDNFNHKYITLFNSTSGEILSVGYLSSGDGSIKMFVNGFHSDFRIVLINNHIHVNPYHIVYYYDEGLKDVGYDYMIFLEEGHIVVYYSNETIKTYAVPTGPLYYSYMKTHVRSIGDYLLIYSSNNNRFLIYIFKNGRLLKGPIYIPDVMARGLGPKSPNIYTAVRGFTPSWIWFSNRYKEHDWIYEKGIDAQLKYLYTVIFGIDNLPDTYNGMPAVYPEILVYPPNTVANAIYKSSDPLNSYFAQYYLAPDTKLYSGQAKQYTFYFNSKSTTSGYSFKVTVKNGYPYFKVDVYENGSRIASKTEDKYLGESIKSIPHLYNIYNWVLIDPDLDKAYIYAGIRVEISTSHIRDAVDELNITLAVDVDGLTSSGTGASDDGTSIVVYTDENIKLGNLENIVYATWGENSWPPPKVSYHQAGFLNNYTTYLTNIPVYKTPTTLYIAINPTTGYYGRHSYNYITWADYPSEIIYLHPGLYETTDGVNLAYVKGIPGLEYGKPSNILVYYDIIWIFYRTPNGVVVVKG